MEWLARFTEHYRQPISKISADTYREGLSDLNSAQLDAACREAMRTSEFMPVVATIRNALHKIQNTEVDNFTGVEWDPELERQRRERQAAFEAEQQATTKTEPPAVIPKPRRTYKSIEQQKEELRQKGYIQ